MTYAYHKERDVVFTDDGQRLFLSIRDKVAGLLKTAGAVRLQEAIAGQTGDTFHMLACVDRMVELGELRELTTDGPGQYRVFVKGGYND